MFGYVRADTPYLFIKDEQLYRAMYCGLCTGIGEVCGQPARMGLSYDVTFLSIILHNIAGVDVTLSKQRCLAHCIKSRQMSNVDELTKLISAFNTALVYYKCVDDVEDGDKGRMRRLWFRDGMRRVRKKYPDVERMVRKHMEAQAKVERSQTDSVDRAADATANMLAEFSDYALREKSTPNTHNLFYALGKWIYLIDALDDYDKDVKKGSYNPFYLAYGKATQAELLVGELGEEIRFIFHAIFYDIRENLSQIEFRFNRDLSDNILLRGLPMMTKRIMDGCNVNGKCKCKHKKKEKNKH